MYSSIRKMTESLYPVFVNSQYTSASESHIPFKTTMSFCVSNHFGQLTQPKPHRGTILIASIRSVYLSVIPTNSIIPTQQLNTNKHGNGLEQCLACAASSCSPPIFFSSSNHQSSRAKFQPAFRGGSRQSPQGTRQVNFLLASFDIRHRLTRWREELFINLLPEKLA